MDIFKQKNSKVYLIILLLSFTGLVFSLLSTSLFGVGLSPDSVQYIATARNLLQGKFFVTWNDAPMVVWPPLYPALAAGISFLTGIDPLDSTRFINAGAFCLTVGAAGLLFSRYFQTKIMVFCGTLATLLAASLLSASSIALTEALFSLLVILFLLYFPASLSGNLSKLMPVILITALCCLQRYMGVAILFTGLILLVSRYTKTTLPRKFKMAVIYGVGSSLPLALWVIHNYVLTGTPTGPRSPGTTSIFSNVLATTYIIFNWFLPLNLLETLPNLFIAVLIIFSLGLLVILLITLKTFFINKSKVGSNDNSGAIWPIIIFVIVYSGWLLISAMIADFDAISDRLLIPIYVPLIFLFLAGSRKVLSSNLKTGKPLVRGIVVGLWAIGLIYLSTSTFSFLAGSYQNGAWGYNTTWWRNSVTMQWLKDNPPQGPIYSNAADAIYILTGNPAYPLPEKTAGITDLNTFKNQITEKKGLIVYFAENIVERPYLMSEEDFLASGLVDTLETSPDGRVYTYKV